MTDTIELVVCCDENYMPPLRTMLMSVVINNPGERFRLWLLHSTVGARALEELDSYCSLLGMRFDAVTVDREAFEEARSSKRYPQEMYYRMFAPRMITEAHSRLLYLDPDILVINPLRALWEIDLEGNSFAAASHLDAVHPATALNKVRLDTDHQYFNTGVILMDAEAARKVIVPSELLEYAQDHEYSILFPDQDLFNALYGCYTLAVKDVLWNYDARKYADYYLRTMGSSTMQWVMANTSILHFCGREKPWQQGYSGRFDALYKNYDQVAQRAFARAVAQG